MTSTLITKELEYVIRSKSFTFHQDGAIDHAHFYCSEGSTVFSAYIMTIGNATVYHTILKDWLKGVDSHLVLGHHRYAVRAGPCGFSLDNLSAEKCAREPQSTTTTTKTTAETDTIATSTTALIIAFIALSAVVVLLVGLILYILLAKCCQGQHGKR